MPILNLHMNGDGALKDLPIDHHNPEGFTLIALDNGMASGRTSIMVAIETPGGLVVAQASLRQLQVAVDALTAAHGRQ